ncbi:Na+/H+ antiporter NhaA [Aeromicrobium sp. Leaf272]|uniref:Na+/H+ antiporter NhaA n=1 Tax=Aeromicrobium sp. Leaf272 TaxID=1736317 RepID=UPI0006F6A076|nr:Na+/H+ antiporter NhaA [Aeromicrobium sp. Leaf272]KQP27696.1 sodium:proton antiporter [Aeromicrobium sp. Leaf272]
MTTPRRRLLTRGSWLETQRIGELVRAETFGGALLMIAAILALIAANTTDTYAQVRDTVIGPASLHLDLSIGAWAADGLLAIFFFVVGLELKREFVAGDLRDPSRAAVPIVAAIGGMATPALIYVAINSINDAGRPVGWAIPAATDIAFAIAVLAVVGSFLPTGLRLFLLTLAIVDDLLAITIIAIFYTSDLDAIWLLLALLPIAAFGALVQQRIRSPWLLIPLAVTAWALVHASGVHATVAGVLLGFTVPVLRRDGQEGPGLAEHLEEIVRPLSSTVAVPVFAFFSAGVAIEGASGFVEALRDPVTLGIIAGLVIGKPLGVLLFTWLMARFTKAELDDDLEWIDLVGVGLLAGIGFTVALLVGELAFGVGSESDEHVKVGVLLGSLTSALLAVVVLRLRNRTYRLIHERETRDDDADGIPDVYQG